MPVARGADEAGRGMRVDWRRAEEQAELRAQAQV